MDPSSYKDVVNTRGFKYHYYHVPARDQHPTIVFVHGFPNTSRDWRRVIPFFEQKGYGIIAPDMLGYRGTDKPTDYNAYQFSLLTKDIVDILDVEGVKQAVAVGHDWGAFIVSRLANFYPERFLAYATLCVPYVLPDPNYTYEGYVKKFEDLLGFNAIEYWDFFTQEGAAKLMEDKIESFMCTLFPIPDRSSGERKKTFTVKNAVQLALQNNYRSPLPEYMTETEQQHFIETFRKGGFAAPLSYYKIMVNEGRRGDDAAIPEERRVPPVSTPLFFGAALRDSICHPDWGRTEMRGEAFKDHNVTIREFDGNHWILLDADTVGEVNRELGIWIENVVLPSVGGSA
ncbi:epoxide hydrolase [Cristinia sonorae]|uniref:Epoxide hydrolase n=1 Tax=Cristinia sonorae TaxID=1940300 RepID=A0A8K0XQF5_9AGAR|nr:epoxide hydrolase [Cristinia sonorae]